MDKYIRETVMNVSLLSDSQHANQSGRSTDTAALYCLKIALAVYLDTEGPFDKVSIATILRALKEILVISDTGFLPIPMLTYEEILPQVCLQFN